MKKLTNTKFRIVLMMFLIFFTSFGLSQTTASAVTNSTKSINRITLKIGSTNVTQKTYKMTKGESSTLNVTVKPVSSKKQITYKSSNKKILNTIHKF